MNNIEALVRPNIIALKPYSSARSEFSEAEGIFLDANENPFGTLNRYPDPDQVKLKQKLSEIRGIAPENIFLGNGSDEIIDLAIRIFCQPGKDKIIICPPSYGMYEVAAQINDVGIINIALNQDFEPDIEQILATDAKILFLCSPNNPTGNALKGIDTLIRHFNGIVFVDEAYIDFSEEVSYQYRILESPKLIVSQTFSKAWGKAGIRIGIAFANKEIVALLNKIKPPYNISQLNQEEAIKALEDSEKTEAQIKNIKLERSWLMKALEQVECVEKVYPSDANFILIKTNDANHIYQQLVNAGIIVRNRHRQINQCLRITVGKPSENRKLIQTLQNLKQ